MWSDVRFGDALVGDAGIVRSHIAIIPLWPLEEEWHDDAKIPAVHYGEYSGLAGCADSSCVLRTQLNRAARVHSALESFKEPKYVIEIHQ